MAGPLPTDKPPFGLKPRWLADEQRAAEVSAAIYRYERAGLPIPGGWEDEIRYLQGRAIQHRREATDKDAPNSFEAMLSRAAIYKEKRAVCVDACGDCGLTEGKEYEIVGIIGGMIRVTSDAGEVREYFMERFR